MVSILLAGCGSTPEIIPNTSAPAPEAPIPTPPEHIPQPLDARMSRLAAAHTHQNFNALPSFFTANAIVQSPAMPQKGSPAEYARTTMNEPFRMDIASTEILYVNSQGAKTRSHARISAPARYALEEPIEALWQFEDGQWRISSLTYPEWPSIVGTWRRAGARGEHAIELRILPGGTYFVYASEDRTLPSFKGTYQLAGNQILMTDTSAAQSGTLSPEEGRYSVITSGSKAEFHKIEDENRWRAARFDGMWSAAR